MNQIDIAAADGSGSFSAYCATPAGGRGAGVVVLQEIFGVNGFLREVCDHYAGLGYIAVCPDLFWRIEPGVELTDRTQAEWDRAFELMNAFLPMFEQGVADIQATVSAVRELDGCTGKVGAAGYCLGGSLAFAAACHTDVDAAAGYYPVQIEDSLDMAAGIGRPLVLHLAGSDSYCPPEAQRKIADALAPNPHVTVHTYPGAEHAFARTGGEHHDAEAAAAANARTEELFAGCLG